MKLQKAVIKETLHIAFGVLALAAIMNIIFLIFGYWQLPVLFGSLLGSFLAIVNFFALAVTVQQIANSPQDEKRGKLKLQFSYSVRMFLIIVILIIAIQFDVFNWLATAIPLLFPRITILVMQLSGMYKPDKQQQQRGDDINGNNN